MFPRNPPAQQVSEHLLALPGRALLAGDAQAFTSAFMCPFELETANGKRMCHAPRDIQDVFQTVHDHLKQMRVTILARHCVAAEFRAPDEVVATHETRLISNGLLIEDSFPTLSVIVRGPNDAWKIRAASYDVPENSLYHSAFDR